MRRSLPTPFLAGVLVLALAAGACSDDDSSADDSATSTTGQASGGATSSTGPATTSSSAGTGTTAAPGGAGCTGTAPPVPDGSAEGEVVDLDGDGRRDRAWMAPTTAEGGRRMGVVTAAGGGAEVTVQSASPQALRLLAVDADQQPPVELFVSDGRTVQLWAFADCAIQVVTNPEGEQYLFDLGFRGTGTGIGCLDTEEGARLVGLNVVDDDGTTVSWSRTVVERDGLAASNGATDEGTFTHGRDDAAIELLHTVSCGDLTIDADGIRQPEA